MSNIRKKTRVLAIVWLAIMMTIGYDHRSWAVDVPVPEPKPEWERLNSCSLMDRQVFLCMLATGFITSQQVLCRGRLAWIPAHVYRLENIPLARIVYKWTGDRVRISFQGMPAAADAYAAMRFFDQLNGIIGRDKFVVVGNNEMADIQITMGKPIFSKDDICSGRIGNSGFCDFSPPPAAIKILEGGPGGDQADLPQHRQRPRCVQVWVQGFLDQTLRDNALRHELMHAVGFPGHSPEADSLLFPVQLCPYEGSATRRMSTRDERMVCLLYQTPITDGMNLVQVREVLQIISGADRPAPIPVGGFFARNRE